MRRMQESRSWRTSWPNSKPKATSADRDGQCGSMYGEGGEASGRGERRVLTRQVYSCFLLLWCCVCIPLVCVA